MKARKLPRRRGAKWRSLVFSLAVLAVFLTGLSALLGYLEEKSLVDTGRPDDSVAYLNPDWLGRENTPNGWYFRIRGSQMLESRFSVIKPHDVYRIIATGESFMMGSPYVEQDHPGFGGIPDWLRTALPQVYPSRRFEVVNAAAGAQSSDRVRQIVESVFETAPDLIIVATGNNEGYVPFSPVNAFLHKWNVYRWLKKILLPGVRKEDRPYFSPQDKDNRRIELNFEKNIRRIMEACEKRRVRLLLATLPINYKFEGRDPGIHGNSDDEQDAHIENARDLIRKGLFEAAISSLRKSRNPGEAALYIGISYEKMGNLELAKTYYQTHVQLVPKNRTRPSYNDFVRKVAREKRLLLADLAAYAESLSPAGIASPELFVDYCHLTRKGYHQMALEIIRVLVENRVIPAAEDEPRADVLEALKQAPPIWVSNKESDSGFIPTDAGTTETQKFPDAK